MEQKHIIMDIPYFQVPNSIFEIGLNSYQLSVYMYLCRCCNNGKAGFPSYSTIAARCGMSRRKSIDVIRELEDKQLVIKALRPKSSCDNETNLYKIMLPGAQNTLGNEFHALG